MHILVSHNWFSCAESSRVAIEEMGRPPINAAACQSTLIESTDASTNTHTNPHQLVTPSGAQNFAS